MASNPFYLLPKPTTLNSPQTLPNTAPSPPHPLPKTFSISCSFSPPSSREEAISQARSRLFSSLQKPLNNPLPLPTRKLKKQRQPRFRVEIPIADCTNPTSLTSLAADLFSSEFFIKRGASSNLLLIWPSSEHLDFARRDFASKDCVFHSDIAFSGNELVSSVDLAVFLAPDVSMLEEIRGIVYGLGLKSVVLLNPKWGFEEEKDFDGQMRRFVGSFDVVYSFMVLEVKGVLSRRKGAVFKSGRDDEWLVMVEDEGVLQVVSRFERRPEIGEVENVLYNLMAANSPITKSVKFFRDLASGIAGKKQD